MMERWHDVGIDSQRAEVGERLTKFAEEYDAGAVNPDVIRVGDKPRHEEPDPSRPKYCGHEEQRAIQQRARQGRRVMQRTHMCPSKTAIALPPGIQFQVT